MWTANIQIFKLVLEKAEEPEIKLPTSAGSSNSKRIPEKYLHLLYWLHQSLCVDHNKLENSERDGNTRPPDLPPEKWRCEKLHSICQQIWKTQQWPEDWKRSVFIPIPKKGNAKECSSYHTIALISRASKVMLNILQARLQQYVNRELPDVQAGCSKGRGTRDQIANICWITQKASSSRKTSISALLTMPKPLTVWITINCGKFWKRWEYQTS